MPLGGNIQIQKRGEKNMKKKLLSLMVAAGLLLWGLTGTVFAGVGPSPFQPEINKLNSIEINIAVIQKSLGNYVVSRSLPIGTKLVLSGIKYNLSSLDSQLADVLAELPPYDELGDGQMGVYYALEGLRINILSMGDPFDYILWRMGIEPAPFKKALDSISNRISGYTGISCAPGTICPQF
jgi:hypothetical protein